MAIVSKLEALNSIETRQTFGRPNFYGQSRFGHSFFGDSETRAGIYQIRRMPQGRVLVREKFYVPKNPQTELQQANRQKFAQAVAGWQALSQNEREQYKKAAVGFHLTGYNLYLRQQMYA